MTCLGPLGFGSMMCWILCCLSFGDFGRTAPRTSFCSMYSRQPVLFGVIGQNGLEVLCSGVTLGRHVVQVKYFVLALEYRAEAASSFESLCTKPFALLSYMSWMDRACLWFDITAFLAFGPM
eukprot:CAMPEP_0181465630 /NCGR_PEP_ID=MMETSP1110-20121109/36049_1 /TAXON_ID=174948 /ORGANISM="Symbiodinium sp., Strain CCMP421" /LENGTH=121 /DNA_ID=CAMNT_0023590405 /DNA_START=81 /DNA_END=446 /DNA_ORIENTATION=-